MKLIISAFFLFFTLFVNDAYASDLKTFLTNRAIELPGPWYKPGTEPETIEQRNERLKTIVSAIVDSAYNQAQMLGWTWSSDDLAMAAFVKTYHESGRWDVMIHNGKKRGDRGRSTCIGQIWGGGNKLVGVDYDHTVACVKAVMKHLTFHMHRCLNEHTKPTAWAMAKVYSAYGTGWSCSGNISRITNGSEDHWARNRAYDWWRLRTSWMK